jgi:cell division protein ZapA
MQEMIPLNIVIGDRSYRIRTEAKDEEVVRKTVKTINDKIVEFKTQFAMVLIWFATQVSSTDNALPDEMLGKLQQMETQLNEALGT